MDKVEMIYYVVILGLFYMILKCRGIIEGFNPSIPSILSIRSNLGLGQMQANMAASNISGGVNTPPPSRQMPRRVMVSQLSVPSSPRRR